MISLLFCGRRHGRGWRANCNPEAWVRRMIRQNYISIGQCNRDKGSSYIGSMTDTSYLHMNIEIFRHIKQK